MIGTACGWKLLADAGNAAMLAAEGLDEALPAVVRALRRASTGAVAQTAPERRFGFHACTYVLAGWSARTGRFVAYELPASAFFEPLLTTCTARPRLHAPPPLHPLELAEVLELAAHQAAALNTPAGRVTIATTTLGGMRLHPPMEIPEIAPMPSPSASTASTPCGRVEARCEGRPDWAPGAPSNPHPDVRLVPRAA